MSSSMEFWASCVKPNKPVKVDVGEGKTLRLTQCSLGETVKAGRSVLKVQAAGKKCVLASLMADKIESSVLELMFEEGEVEFSVAGPNEIHLAGNMLDNDDGDDMGGMMGEDDDDEDDEEDDEEDEEDDEEDDEEEDAPPQKSGKKAAAKIAEPMEEDDEDDEDDEEDDEDDEEDDEEEEEDEDDEEEEEEQQVGKKRAPPAAKAAPQSATKQQKTPAKATPGKDAGSATKSSPMQSPRAGAKEVPADVKNKLKKLVSGHPSGIKGSDLPREWEKAHKAGFKDTWSKLGFKKMAEFLTACDDVIRKEELGGGNITFYPKGK